MTPEPAGPRRRPQWDESRRRIVETARARFAADGYRATTTKEIAAGAGVSEMTVFRHFETKTALFDVAVLQPVREFVEVYRTTRADPSIRGTDLHSRVKDFFEHLLGLNTRDGRLLIALARELGAADPESGLGPELASTMDVFLGRLEAVFRMRIEAHEFEVDPALAPRIIFATVLSIGMNGRWLFTGDCRPSNDELVAELTRLTVWGLSGPPAA